MAATSGTVPRGRGLRAIARRTAVAILFFAGATYGQGNYPARVVSIIVPFPPGGVADIVARAVAPSMERALGQPILVINKAGAGGSVGAAAVASAPPDGYTLLMALASISTNPEQDRIGGVLPSFRLSQLSPIARISIEPMMLAVRAESPIISLGGLVEAAHKRPGKLTYASSGVYGVYHVATEMLAYEAHLSLHHIPYKGGAPALLALLSGEVETGLVTRSVGLKHLQAGTLRPLAALGSARWEQFPDVPTLKELGYDVDYSLWSGLFAPSNTPAGVNDMLRRAVRGAIADPQFRSAMAKMQASIAYLDAPDFKEYWDADSARLIRVVQRLGRLE